MEELHFHDSDGGPIYFETDLKEFLPEPYNLVSSLLFFLLFVYWAFKVYKKSSSSLFLKYSLPLLGIGAIGGALYHGTRTHAIFMYLDWVPIVLLTLAASVYFLYRVWNNLWMTLLVYLAILFSITVAVNFIPPGYATNVTYALQAIAVLAPLILFMVYTRFKFANYAILATLFFGVALTFRIIDPQGFLPMGTHFLWHTFGAVAAHFLISYIYITTPLDVQFFLSNKKIEV